LAVQYASEKKVSLVTPKLGETLTFGDPIHNLPWWESIQKLSELREGAPDSSHL
jgi:hypothetical protein